jgi:hypothetical protein
MGYCTVPRNQGEVGNWDSRNLRANWHWSKVGSVQYFYRRLKIIENKKRVIIFENIYHSAPTFALHFNNCNWMVYVSLKLFEQVCLGTYHQKRNEKDSQMRCPISENFQNEIKSLGASIIGRTKSSMNIHEIGKIEHIHTIASNLINLINLSDNSPLNISRIFRNSTIQI